MKYLKVRWVHTFHDEPALIYSELDDLRFEKRKVEVFPSGEYGYASDKKTKGTTRLSENEIPMEVEISCDPQFQIEATTKDEFESVWLKATQR
ncbi:hypothetical protein OIPHN330_58520 (plasmid) [Citrobacter freundii]|uniref:DUF6881 domain-containing protein n=1 Tax=Enterobacteriaceae TaxID=543 RepID=UPI00124FE0E9|nr:MULTISPECIES: hypothetical protein [Enterobacteriaceae]EGR4190770.1 hypothetical protein [Vibrio cholerae]BEJ37232.1 hypothetical protein OIPHN330_58520 [Citrobacter freundii]BBK14981.1 hypothetical protein TMSI_53730 [Klebsiella quasipneumoniae]BBM27950.1 hypothetical protein OIPHN069_44650 [Enterobacter hormaechei subsp. hoffmannii]BEJ43192.1 hypothetical protein OIPHN354_59040 [Citrobacter freundii]